MGERTTHYDLSTIRSGDRLSDDDYKTLGADRHLIDVLLKLGAELHRHTGVVSTVTAPALGPSLMLGTGGTIPAGTRVDYSYTLVDANNLESGASPVAYINTPPPVASPGPPVLSYTTTGGTLLPGSYYYILSAYVSVNNQETPALYAALLSVPAGTSTNAITVTMPALPSGATGWNVYRRKPGGSRFLYLRSVIPPTTSFVDNGSLAEDCDRTEPSVNTTVSSNKVTVTVPALPAGIVAWKLYRTYTADMWAGSLLTTVTTPGTLSYVDTGAGTTTGSPPGSNQAISAPSKILLTDAAEVQGRAAMGSVSGFPDSVEFEFSGLVTATQGKGTWVCPYPQATIKGIRGVLGRGHAPVAAPVIIDVNVNTNAATPMYGSIFQFASHRVEIPVGSQYGPSYPATGLSELREGYAMTVDIDQAGGGATPNDYDLTVVVYLWVYGFGLVSHTWAAI